MIALVPVISGIMMFVFWLNGIQDQGPIKIEGYRPRYASVAPQIDVALLDALDGPKECNPNSLVAVVAQTDTQVGMKAETR